MDRLTKEQRRRNMQAVKNKGSKIEQSLAKGLWALGFRYRKNDRSVFGAPDLTFRKLKIAIFVDGEFWHGKDWETRKHDHRSNQEFWHLKIERNINRDQEVNKKLLDEGWIVLRFWGNDIKKDLETCLTRLQKSIDSQKSSLT